MTLDTLWPLGKTFGLISLVAVGGASATIPEIQHLVVTRHHWMSEATFAHLFAISQASPGPNVLLVSLVGWRVAGPAGLAVSTLAMITPSSCLAFITGRAWRRWSSTAWVVRLQRILAPLAVGLITASGLLIAKTADQSVVNGVLSALAAAFVIFTRRSPMWALGVGALVGAGVALWR